MANRSKALVGVHYVRRQLSGSGVRWHVYAWRGGPAIMTAEQVLKPALTTEAVAAYTKAHEELGTRARADTFAAMVEAYQASPQYLDLAAGTKRNWRDWLDKIKDRFGTAKLRLFSDARMRGEILEWRDKWTHSPRQADFAIQVLSRVLSWGLERGLVMHNPAAGVATLYSADRSEIIWEDHEIEAVAAQMQPHVAPAFKLAAWTGLSRADLIKLRWNEVGDLYISRKRNKTKVEQVIPLFDETRALLKQFKRGSALTVVTNRRGTPFTARGFAMAVERARTDAKLAKGKTLHDLRGTFATRLMRAGFEDREIDEILGWETGKSARIRRRYISRKAVVISAIERMRQRPK